LLSFLGGLLRLPIRRLRRRRDCGCGCRVRTKFEGEGDVDGKGVSSEHEVTFIAVVFTEY
jgi:hypothetical protein